MRWIYFLCFLIMSIDASAVPSEILTTYLKKHELCVKDARIRAQSKEDFYLLKNKCRTDYINMVDGVTGNIEGKRVDSIPVERWTKFINSLINLRDFRPVENRIYLKNEHRAMLDGFSVTRRNGKVVVWKDRMQIPYYAIPLSTGLLNAVYKDDRLVISGLDSDILYYAYPSGDAYRVENSYGNALTLTGALFLAEKAIIVYDDEPIGIISRETMKEI
ncbi:MAG: hypothetical protein [Caudoviricetes sp.]|nr:MAG: hypothetical protein [Caudoviricetes sp.]